MSQALLGLTAFWLGVLAGLSPCTLATNVAALSFLARRGAPRQVLASGVMYTLGRSVTYVVLAALLVSGLLSVPGAAVVLTKYLYRLLGPLLIVLGLVLLEWLTFGPFGLRASEATSRQWAERGVWGAGLLGVLFALTFCPVSAALFFGSLVPLALANDAPLLLPLLYGVGTGLPVLLLAVLVAQGAHSLGRVFDRVALAEAYVRRGTGVLFLLLGCYFSLRYIYGLGA